MTETRESDHESGVIAAFVAVFAFALLVVTGLVVDAGRSLTASELAQTLAFDAARAGTQQVSVNSLYQGEVELDCSAAIEAATNYLAASGATGSATCAPTDVRVHVVVEEPTVILNLVGIDRIHGESTADVTVEHGITTADG